MDVHGLDLFGQGCASLLDHFGVSGGADSDANREAGRLSLKSEGQKCPAAHNVDEL